MVESTHDMSISRDFDLQAVYAALDEKRQARGSSWNEVAREINAQFREVPNHRPIATSTITRLKTAKVSGTMPLQMLLWLDRTPESFVPEFENAAAERFKLRRPDTKHILRFDTKAIYAALDEQRNTRGMTWTGVAAEIGCTRSQLRNLARGGLTGFPFVMRMTCWLGKPTAAFTRPFGR
jgi:hypothetical protein